MKEEKKMAGIKYEEKIYFPEGHVYILMNDEWSVDVTGEQGIDGDLVGMGSWDFKTCEAWSAWGNIVIDRIHEIKETGATPEIRNTRIYDLYHDMPERIREQLIDY